MPEPSSPLATISPSRSLSRRRFLLATGGTLLAPALLRHALSQEAPSAEKRIAPAGPASQYIPKLKAAFVRRKGDYGILWPGAIYDGEAARRGITRQTREAEAELGLQVDLRPEPIYTPAEADQWLAEAKAAKPDGLLVVLLDRQEHAWPTAAKAIESQIPTVIFAPVGAAFTTNTAPLAHKTGAFICSTSDFGQARYGLKMIKAAAKLREMRFIVLQGGERSDTRLDFLGTRLRYLPAQSFLDEYNQTPLTAEIRAMASAYLKAATGISGPTEQDLFNGVKSYVVARNILEREEGDGITMDCLGALGKTQVSLPCIAWSRMLDHGIPAACEADLNAAVTHALVQFLFDRPGFQQDPVAETAKDCLIGAHCTCPTRLRGFSEPPEPFDLSHHHGKRDAVPRPTWRVGQKITIANVLLKNQPTRQDNAGKPQMVIASGTVVENIAVPPAGGCVVSVMVKLDSQSDLLTFPGFHQLFFYGDYKKHLLSYCQLFGLQPVVA